MKAIEQHYDEIQNQFDLNRHLKNMYIFGSNSASILIMNEEDNHQLESNREDKKCIH